MKQIPLLIFVLFSVNIIAAQELKKLDNVSRDSDYSAKATQAFNLDSLITECLADISADSIEHYMRELEGFGTRFCLAPNHKEVAEYLMEKFVSFGYSDVKLDSFLYVSTYFVADTTWQYNVVATLSGTINSETEYIAGAHYDDHVFGLQINDTTAIVPGADDNASGVSATLEIARIFALNNIQPYSTIKFVCFAAEEFGGVDDSAKTGANHYSANARINNDDIGFMISMDMIANNINSDTMVTFHYYDDSYLINLSVSVCDQFTSLTPSSQLMNLNSPGGDSDFFRMNGFDALWVMEYHVSPYYHTVADTVGNYNMQYCSEVAKITGGALLKASFLPRPVQHLDVLTVNNCVDAFVKWNNTKDDSISGYNIRIGTVSGVYDTIIFVADTFYEIDYLLPDIKYYIAVSTLNSSGFESCLIEDTIRTCFCSFNEGILIVDGSDGALNNPGDEDIDTFYDNVLYGFQRTNYSADSIGCIDLETLGRYSSVLWHVNSGSNTNSLMASETALKNYLSSGGNVFFTLYRPLKCLENDYSIGNIQYKEGSFAKDFLKIKSSVFSVTSYFNNANPLSVAFDTLHCDSDKTGGMMKYVESLNPVLGAESIYWYDSPNDSSLASGELKYKSVGILYDGVDYKTITLGFPLYFMGKDATQAMLRHVFETVFGEIYTGIEHLEKNEFISVFPNPADDYLHVLGADLNNVIITDLYGRVVLNSVCDNRQLYIGNLAQGVYCLHGGAKSVLFVKL